MTGLADPFRHWTMMGPLIIAAAAALTTLLIFWLRPWMMRYALARPNARSSHRTPTPQGGGIAVMVSAILIAALTFALTSGAAGAAATSLYGLLLATVFIASLGAADDIKPIEVVPRLLAQALAVGIVIATLPSDLNVTPFLPWWAERVLLFVAGLWFVNLFNFMDGLDLMTVAEVLPVTGGLVLLGALGALPAYAVICALALFGATLGFAPFNRPVARLFLGDVGSLPLGLVVGWLLAILAGGGHLAAALLLPLYYLADATLTLLRRLRNGERIAQAHRTHFYQLATDRGFTASQVVAAVFACNLLLVGLAVLSVLAQAAWMSALALLAGTAIVGVMLARLHRGRR